MTEFKKKSYRLTGVITISTSKLLFIFIFIIITIVVGIAIYYRIIAIQLLVLHLVEECTKKKVCS